MKERDSSVEQKITRREGRNKSSARTVHIHTQDKKQPKASKGGEGDGTMKTLLHA